MKHKRLFTVFMAVAIAGMLIALPYESNAILPVVVGIIAFGLGTAVGLWLASQNSKNAVDNVQYEYNATVVKQEWDDKFQDIENQFLWANSTAHNLVSVFNNTDLVYIRYAERKALEHLDKDNWSEVTQYIYDKLDEDVKAIYINILLQFTPPLNEMMSEFYRVGKINSLASGDDISVIYLCKTATGSTLQKTFWTDNTNVTWAKAVIGIGIGTSSAETIKDRIKNESLYIDMNSSYSGIVTTLDIENTTADSLLNSVVKFYFYGETESGSWHLIWTGDLYAPTSDSYYFDNSGTGQYKYHGWRIEASLDGGSDVATSTWVFDKHIALSQLRDALKNTYTRIKLAMEDNAYSLWSYYKSLGYDNISDLPSDEVPVFPDNILDNVEALGNLSYEDAYLIYLQYLNQLANNPDLLNQSTIDWDDLYGANYTGKVANITLVWANDTVSNIIFNAHRCYIVPLEEDLSISVGNAYWVGDLTITDATKNNMMTALNVSILYRISQQIYIYDIDAHVIYYIKPTNRYAFYVHSATMDNKQVSNLVYDINNMGKLYFPYLYYDENIPYPVFDNNDSFSWINEYKGLITVACIVLGIIFTASSRKGSGGHTFGIILLLAGIGLAFYWYILPTWDSITSFWDKLTFWD